MIYSEKNKKQNESTPKAFEGFEAPATPDVSSDPFENASITFDSIAAFDEPSGDAAPMPVFDETPFEQSAAVQDYKPRLPMPKKKNKLIRPWGYVGLLLLFAIPVIGFIFLIVYCFSDKDRNRKNFARGYFLYGFIGLLLTVGWAAAAYFTVLQPHIAKYGNNLTAVSSMLDSYISQDAYSLDDAQLSAMQSGDLSKLTAEQKEGVTALLGLLDEDFLRQYLPAEEKQAGKSSIVTELPAPLPDTFNDMTISAFTTPDTQYYTVINVSEKNYNDFTAALEDNYTVEARDENGERYHSASLGQTVVMSYSAKEKLLTIIVF